MTPQEHHQKRGGRTGIKRESGDDVQESQLPCLPSHPLDHRPQASAREKAPIKHRPKSLVSRQRRKYPSVQPRPQQAGTTCGAARVLGGGIRPMRRDLVNGSAKCAHAPSTALARAIRATRRGSETLVWRGGPRSSLQNAPNGAGDDRPHEHEALLARRVRYVRFCDWRRMRDK